MKKPYGTKAARRALAESFRPVAEAIGAEFDVTPCPLDGDKELTVTIRKGPFRVFEHLDANPLWLGHWVADKGATFPRDFPNVNPFHFGKATTYASGPADLQAQILDGFKRLAT